MCRYFAKKNKQVPLNVNVFKIFNRDTFIGRQTASGKICVDFADWTMFRIRSGPKSGFGQKTRIFELPL